MGGGSSGSEPGETMNTRLALSDTARLASTGIDAGATDGCVQSRTGGAAVEDHVGVPWRLAGRGKGGAQAFHQWVAGGGRVDGGDDRARQARR